MSGMVTDTVDRAVSPLRHLHDTQVSLEKLRISVGNRVSAIGRGVDGAEAPVPDVYAEVLAQAEAMEKVIDAGIERALGGYAVWESWLQHVRGIGPGLAGQMLALLLPPIPTKGPSSWYKAAGLAPETRPDGESRLPRPRKVRCPDCASTTFRMKEGVRLCTECARPLEPGEGKLAYHPWLRRCLYNVGDSFVKNGAYYREVYDQAKSQVFGLHAWKAAALYNRWHGTSGSVALDMLVTTYGRTAVEKAATRTRTPTKKDQPPETVELWAIRPTIAKTVALEGISDPAWPLHRIESVARWKMVKLFLAHLWEAWSDAEGIERRVPYVVEKLGHQLIPRPMPDGKGKI